MRPRPQSEDPNYRGSGKLFGKVALITGGDSGIGRAIAYAFAKEGARIAIVYLDEHRDAKETAEGVKNHGQDCLLIAGDVGRESFCKIAVQKTVAHFGRLDILVNNAAEQHPQESLGKITEDQLHRTFRTNVYAYFFMAKAALPHLKRGSSIINTTSVTAYRGSDHLLDYSASKGAVTAFTRSLSQTVVDKGIRVNGVAPGPIWTPLIPATFPKERLATFGKQTPMKRAGQPSEVAPSYVFLASDDSSYITGQIIHPNGGSIINT